MKLVNIGDLKSPGLELCGFESHHPHGVQPPTPTEIIRWHELKFDFYKNFCYNRYVRYEP